MKKENEKLFPQNKPALLSGILSGLISAIFLTELFQAFTTIVLNGEFSGFGFSMKGFYCNYSFAPGLSAFTEILISLSPVIFSIFVIELASFFLRKTGLGFYRFTLIVFVLINVGYLIIKFFYGAFAVIFKMPDNDWTFFLQSIGVEGQAVIPVIFFAIIFLIAYLNFSSRRLIKYFSVQTGDQSGIIKK
ncbi:MAG: hypothetical protein V1720_11190 [bacterium]